MLKILDDININSFATSAYELYHKEENFACMSNYKTSDTPAVKKLLVSEYSRRKQSRAQIVTPEKQMHSKKCFSKRQQYNRN